MFNIVLHEPEIPQNTGNIARTCAATGCKLHIIEPIAFSIDDRQVKRAGLDYWDKVFVKTYPDFGAYLRENDGPVFPVSTKGEKRYTDAQFPAGASLLFGKETAGLPADILQAYQDTTVRIPMRKDLRSLNLSNSVAILVYEALRQHGFAGLV